MEAAFGPFCLPLPTMLSRHLIDSEIHVVSGGELGSELAHWLSDAPVTHSPARALIVPYV